MATGLWAPSEPIEVTQYQYVWPGFTEASIYVVLLMADVLSGVFPCFEVVLRKTS